MTNSMSHRPGTSLETRPSLLNRLKHGDDPATWHEFYDTYGGLIRFFADKAGLTADEAEEVVQETAIGVARRLPKFVYDPKVCRFKTWLLNLTRWRIRDQFRKRRPAHSISRVSETCKPRPGQESTSTTATVERIQDETIPEFGAEWDAAWEKNLLAQALKRVRDKIDERQFQVFDLNVSKGWSPKDIAQTLGISVARVYLTKHRVSALLKKEVMRLEGQVGR